MRTPKRRRASVSSADTLRIRDFRLLVALHEAGNLTAAAQQVGITQPAATKQVQAMHRRLKVRLYDSEAGEDKLTPSAHALLPAAVDIVQAYHRGMHEVHEALLGGEHLLRVGASSYLHEHWHRLLDSIELRLHRNVKVHLNLDCTEELLLALQRHDLDVVLVNTPQLNGKLATRCVDTKPFMLVFRESHPLAKRKSVTLAEILPYPWIFFRRSLHRSLHDLILRRAELAGGGVRIAHRVDQPAHVPQLLTDDLTLAWLTPAGAEHIDRPGIAARPLDDPEIRIETHIAVLANNTSSLVAEYYKGFLKRVEEDHSPIQLTLPILLPVQGAPEHQLSLRWSA